jgi:hypothetical protein
MHTSLLRECDGVRGRRKRIFISDFATGESPIGCGSVYQ